jgi:hypothetical protein
MRSYKGGKKFLIKANIKQDKINLYDENEKKLTLADYDNNNEIIPLLNINGIRFSKSSFIIDVILVQFMVLYPCDSLENQILIKINKKKEDPLENNNAENNKHTLLTSRPELTQAQDQELMQDPELKQELTQELMQELTQAQDPELAQAQDNNSFKYLMNNLEKNQTIDDDCELEITNLDVITENSDPIEIKSHESIYLEIYKKAKQKAKEIRRNAVEAFLEAKNIKIKYNLTNIANDSSSDEDI